VTTVESFLAGNGTVSRLAYRVARAIVVTWERVWLRLTIEGREHVPASGPFVLAPVHRSNMDTPIAAAVTRRRLRFMGKHTLWRRRVPAWVLSSLGGFPVVRHTADRQALQRCIQVLESGEPLVLFPEGERKFGPVVQPLYDGAVYVAVKARVPIVPVGIGGSERVMPKGSRFIRPCKVHVVVGAPIPPPVTDGGHLPRSAVRQHSATLHDELQRLFDRAQQRAGVEAGAPDHDGARSPDDATP
jgi:1-acyl-sn-glycerol-3-phosphate acyltransferase